MAVRLYFGYTKSGKSRLCNFVVSKFDRVVIFDKQHCFDGDVYEEPNEEIFRSIFKKYKTREKFKIVIRPGRLCNKERTCDNTIKLASALGRILGKNAPEEKYLQLVIDEADSVCNSNYQSPKLKFIINEGRHDNVDTHCIARNPNRLHTDLRTNATRVAVFGLKNVLEIPYLVNELGKENAKIVKVLEKWWHVESDETGTMGLYDENYKLVKDLSGETQSFRPVKTSKKVRRK